MRITSTRTVALAATLGVLVGLTAVLKAQADRAGFRSVLSKAIDAAERGNFESMEGRFKEQIFDDLNTYSCDVLLPGAESCEVHAYDGRQALKNFVVWFYGEGKTQEAANQLFSELMENIKQAVPSGWVGRETPKSALGPRDLREFRTNTKEDGGPMITILATRRAELFTVRVQMNAVHVN
jgi:hypothetical protein